MPHLSVSDGVRLAYEVVGQGEPLLLIPGTGQGGGLWALQVLEYSARYQCILLDNRGAGASDVPDSGYTIAQMARDAADVIRALQLGRVHVAGQSMGSAIAQELALEAPPARSSAITRLTSATALAAGSRRSAHQP